MTPFPDWIVPMAATLTQERFAGPEWLFERKLDGIRLLAFRSGEDVRLLSRNRLPQHLPAVSAAIAALPVTDLILDGELTWGQADPGYHVFDLLWLDGRRRHPAAARRAPGAARRLAARAAAAARPARHRRQAVGARVRRGVGRGHRQAPRHRPTSTAARRTG